MFRCMLSLLLSIFAYSAFAEEDRFASAEKSYQVGDFASALTAYEKAWDDGVRNSAVLFNLGNAAYRSEDLGKAVAAFLAARDLDPRDQAITTNLAFVLRKLSEGEVAKRSQKPWLSVFEPLFFFRAEEAYLLAAILWFVGLTVLALRMFIAMPRPFLALASLLWLASLYVAGGIALRRSLPQWGAVCTKSLVVRAEPSPQAPEAETLSAGAPLLLSANRKSWVRIERPSGEAGWAEGKDICYFDTSSVW